MKNITYSRPALTGLLAIAILSGCATTGVNKGDVNLVSLEEEWQLGQQLEADLAKKLDLVNDKEVVGYVNKLGQSLVAGTELAGAPWRFHVVRDAEINAFNIPGGHVYVNTGLIAAADNASELAGVMGHEIAHGVARHGTEQLTKVYGLNFLAGAVLGQQPETYEKILAQILGSGAIAKFSRGAEEEADALGLRYVYAAGYDPEGMATLFEKLLARRQGSPGAVGQFFSTHPLTEERIRDTRARIAQLPSTQGLKRDEPGFQQVRRKVR